MCPLNHKETEKHVRKGLLQRFVLGNTGCFVWRTLGCFVNIEILRNETGAVLQSLRN
jgi:hypothetical protein